MPENNNACLVEDQNFRAVSAGNVDGVERIDDVLRREFEENKLIFSSCGGILVPAEGTIEGSSEIDLEIGWSSGDVASRKRTPHIPLIVPVGPISIVSIRDVDSVVCRFWDSCSRDVEIC